MKVKELIKELRKLPLDLEVGVAMHDNSEHEVAGWVYSVIEDTDNGFAFDNHRNNEYINPVLGKKCVVLRC